MRSLYRTILIAAVVLVAGCKTTEERIQERRQTDMSTCRAYGFNPGTEAYGACLMQRDLAREQAEANERTARRTRRCINTTSNPPPAAGAASGFLSGFARGMAC
jgi:hypothetical protein